MFRSRISLVLQLKPEIGDKFGSEAGVLFVQKKFVDLGQAEVWKNCYEMVGFGGYDMHVELRVMPLIGNSAAGQGGAGSPPGNSKPARGRSRGRPPLKRM